jgi:hypothetical protein
LRERLGEKAPNRRQLVRWRGKNNASRKAMTRILWAVREVCQNPDIRVDELFDFDPANPENWK